jgi:hypothetical protein
MLRGLGNDELLAAERMHETSVDPPVLPTRVYAPGSKNAIADAGLILEVVRATAAWQLERDVPAVVKPIRELIWFVWEQPRLVDASTLSTEVLT